MKFEIFKQVRKLVEQEKKLPIGKSDGQYLIDAEDILLEYLKQYPQDIEGWLLLLCVETNPPLDNFEEIISYAKQFLKHHPYNPYALLFWSYADYYLMANDNEELYQQLCDIKCDDNEIMGMIDIAKARYCEKRDIKSHERYLLESIQICPRYVINYAMLGQFYIEQGKKKDGIKLIEQGFDNIQRLVTPENAGVGSDPIGLQDFLNEFFTGTTIVYVEYGRLYHLIKDAELKPNNES